jgi:hypothetical protein
VIVNTSNEQHNYFARFCAVVKGNAMQELNLIEIAQVDGAGGPLATVKRLFVEADLSDLSSSSPTSNFVANGVPTIIKQQRPK